MEGKENEQVADRDGCIRGIELIIKVNDRVAIEAVRYKQKDGALGEICYMLRVPDPSYIQKVDEHMQARVFAQEVAKDIAVQTLKMYEKLVVKHNVEMY